MPKAAKRKPATRPRGHPTAFKPEYCEQAKQLCEQFGATDADLAEFFHVSRVTIFRWQVAEPEFRAALQLGKQAADERVVRRLYERAIGYSHEAVKIFPPRGKGKTPLIVPYIERFPPSDTAGIFWLKNRMPKDWRERSLHEFSGPDGGPIETRELSDIEAVRLIGRLLTKTIAAPSTATAEPAEPAPTDEKIEE